MNDTKRIFNLISFTLVSLIVTLLCGVECQESVCYRIEMWKYKMFRNIRKFRQLYQAKTLIYVVWGTKPVCASNYRPKHYCEANTWLIPYTQSGKWNTACMTFIHSFIHLCSQLSEGSSKRRLIQIISSSFIINIY